MKSKPFESKQKKKKVSIISLSEKEFKDLVNAVRLAYEWGMVWDMDHFRRNIPHVVENRNLNQLIEAFQEATEKEDSWYEEGDPIIPVELSDVEILKLLKSKKYLLEVYYRA